MNTSRVNLSNFSSAKTTTIKEVVSNADGAEYAELTQAGMTLLQQLADNKAKKTAMASSTGCKKPLINIGKKKKAYQKCLSDNEQKKADIEKRQEELLRLQRELANKPKEKEATVFGMRQDIGIPIVVLGSAVLLFLGYKGIQLLLNKQTIKK